MAIAEDKASELLRLMARIITHLPEVADLSLIAAKGHLIAEEQLYHSVKLKVKEPEHLESAGLKFSNLLGLSKSFYFSQEKSWVWGALKKLNSIRNKYAHSLNPPEAGKLIVEFIELTEAHVGKKNASAEEKFRYCIAMVCAEVLLMSEQQDA